MKKNFPRFFILILFILNFFVWNAVYSEEKQDFLEVSFFDVGQGDAIFIESPSGIQVLIDSGRDNSVLRELGWAMSYYDREIDVVISTHPDADHVGGFPAVFKNYEVETYIDTGAVVDSGAYITTESLVDREGSVEIEAHRGMILDLGAGVYLKTLFPEKVISGVPPNNSSIILKLEYGETSFLLTGDAPESVEDYLVRLGDDLDADVLKVGHHGSKTSSSKMFLEAVTPTYSIISAGENNGYGHPHQVVLDSLAQLNTKILATYEDGTITFLSDGENLWIK